MNKPFLAELRAASAYPDIRRFAALFEILGYVLAFVVLVGAIMTASNNGPDDSHNAMVSLVTAVVIAVGARYVKLSACMFIDMADAKIDMARMMRGQATSHTCKEAE
jgi:hypothetical protein